MSKAVCALCCGLVAAWAFAAMGVPVWRTFGPGDQFDAFAFTACAVWFGLLALERRR